MGYLSVDRYAMRNSMDIINGRKDIVFDLTEDGHYGEAEAGAGTIHLNRKAATENTAESLLFYTSTVVREGVLIDSGLIGKDRMTAYARELGATGIQTGVLNSLQSIFGVDMYGGNSEYSKVANLLAHASATGDLSIFNWESGNSLWVKELGVEIRNQRDNRSMVGNRKIGDVMCNLTALSMALVSMPNNKDLRKEVGMNYPEWLLRNNDKQMEDALEEKRKEMSSYLISKYGTDYRGNFSTLLELAIASGAVQPAEYKPDENGVQWIYPDRVRAFYQWGNKNNWHPTIEDMKETFLDLRSKMQPGDQIIIGGRFNVKYEDNGVSKTLSHIVYVAEITDNGLNIVDPYGGYVKYAMQNYGVPRYDSIDDNLYRRNDKTYEYNQSSTSYYFLPWNKVYEHGVGRNAILLLRPNNDFNSWYNFYKKYYLKQ